MTRLSCIVLIIGFALVYVQAEEFYSDRYDDIDVKGIFANEKLRRQYYLCFIDAAPCITAPQKFFKVIFGDALRTQCRKCTDKQKENLEYIVDWYTKNLPNEWDDVVKHLLEQAVGKAKAE